MSLNIKSKKFRLSSTQLSVYVDQFLNPESSNYNIGVSFEVHSVFDKNKFERTLRQLVIKLDSLRLKFTMDGSEVYQEHIDVTENLTDYIEFVEEDYLKDNQGNDVFFTKLFNLEKSTWRARIVRSDDHNWQWDFCCHHLIADGHSLTNVLINEFITTYVSDDINSCEESKEKPLSYEDFVHDDMEYINSIRYLKDKNFWSNLLQDIPPRLLIPIDETNSKGHVGHAGSLEWEFDGKLYLDIIDKCSQYDCTFTQFIYSTLACYYYRITGCSDIVIGIPLHNRKKASHKKIMGMFSSLTPVLINICETDCFTDILYKTKIAMRSCYKHQNFPLSGINQTINLRKNTGRSQVFDISLSYEVCDTSHSNKNLEISLRKVHRGTHLPLAIAINSYAIEGVDKIYVDFSYLLEYFTIEDIKLFKSRFINIIKSAYGSFDKPIKDLELIDGEEYDRVVYKYNHLSVANTNFETLIHTLFEEQVRRSPEAVALLCGNREVSYDALNRQANRIAHRLIALGVRPGDRVALCAERSAAAVAGILGILKSGAAYVPLDPEYPEDRLRFMLEDAAPAALLTEGRLTGILPGNTPVVLLGDAAHAEEPRDWEHDPDASARGLTARSLAYIIYTSGSTGRPKGVMVEHGNITRLFLNTKDKFHFDSKDTWSLFHSLSFDFSVWELWGALSSGGRLVIVDKICTRSPGDFYALLNKHKVTILSQTPSYFRQIIFHKDQKKLFLRCVILGGEALDCGSLSSWVKVHPLSEIKLVNMYGITEITVHATYHEITQRDIDAPTRKIVGRPIYDLGIYILDGSGQPAPVGVPGEIYIGGAGVARGYHNLPELTDARFLDDPFTARGEKMYRSGDVGRWLADGNIEYLGRNDAQVKLRGSASSPGRLTRRCCAATACWRRGPACARTRRETGGWCPTCWQRAGRSPGRPRCAPRSPGGCRSTCCRRPSSRWRRSP
ncbi:MAG: Dimodular nonribosomal peptide synthase [Candidatus Erwinia impunctatus]|nr:Dimodular nonribosomal peptide synthase [Culicoides impunctatus]